MRSPPCANWSCVCAARRSSTCASSPAEAGKVKVWLCLRPSVAALVDGGCAALFAGGRIRPGLQPGAAGIAMIIAIADQCGTCGKAIAESLALLRASSGRKVLVIDADAAASTWQPRAPLAAGAPAACDHWPQLVRRTGTIDSALPRYRHRYRRARYVRTGGADRRQAGHRPDPAGPGGPRLPIPLIARLNAARMFNPGLHVMFVIAAGPIDPSGADLARIRAYVAQVMAATLCATVIHEQGDRRRQRPPAKWPRSIATSSPVDCGTLFFTPPRERPHHEENALCTPPPWRCLPAATLTPRTPSRTTKPASTPPSRPTTATAAFRRRACSRRCRAAPTTSTIPPACTPAPGCRPSNGPGMRAAAAISNGTCMPASAARSSRTSATTSAC